MTILPQLEHDLSQAAKQRLKAGDPAAADNGPQARSVSRRVGVRRRLASTATVLPGLVAIAVAVVIVVVALTVIHHDRQSGPATPASSVQTSRRQLLGMLGVLRRPQTKADLELVRSPLNLTAISNKADTRSDPRLDRPLLRVVTIPAWHAKVGIEPTTWRPSRRSPHRSEGLDLELWVGSKPTIPPSTDIGTGPQPISVAAFRTHGLALADTAHSKTVLDGVMLLPDGVARVSLRQLRLMKTPVRVDPSRFGAATAAVHNNIASFQLSLPTAFSPSASTTYMFGTSAVAQATWYGASGNIIKHTTTSLPVVIRIADHKPEPGTPATPRRP